MTQADVDTLAMKLQVHSPLSRLSLAEAREVIQKLLDLGYSIVVPAPPAS